MLCVFWDELIIKSRVDEYVPGIIIDISKYIIDLFHSECEIY